jgi:hypothetical protein
MSENTRRLMGNVQCYYIYYVYSKVSRLLTVWGALTTPVLYPCWNAEPKADAMMANSSLPFKPCNKENAGGCCTE